MTIENVLMKRIETKIKDLRNAHFNPIYIMLPEISQDRLRKEIDKMYDIKLDTYITEFKGLKIINYTALSRVNSDFTFYIGVE